MPTYLLHIRCKVSLRHIEEEFDAFEQQFLPDDHYVLSRQGRSANYVVNVEGSVDQFHAMLTERANKLPLDQVSLVELGASFAVLEQGCSSSPTEDACGEWKRRRNPESWELEEVRCRTGLDRWLRRHGLKTKNHPERPIGILIYFHHALNEGSRVISGLRSALGKSSRIHWPDECSLLITAAEPAEPINKILNSKRFARYFDPSVVHTVFCFTLGERERHSHGSIQSVWPPFYRERVERKKSAPKPEPKFELVRGKPPNPRAKELAVAIERLKRGRQSR